MTPSEFNRIRKAFIEDVFGDMMISENIEMFTDIHEEDNEVTPLLRPSMDPQISSPMPEMQAELRLGELLRNAKQSPSLGVYIREKAFRCDMVTYRPALFEQGQISRDYWSKLLNDEIRASKEKLLRVAILLRLSAEEAEEMLSKAGYSISQAILRDVVVEYCLSQQYYDFVVIEQLLADHMIQSLFNDRRGS